MLGELGSIWPWGSQNLSDWSSVLGTLEGAGAFGAGYVLYRRHQCHVHGCRRVGRFPAAGARFVVCRRHHPEHPPTAEQVRAAHEHHKALVRAGEQAG